MQVGVTCWSSGVNGESARPACRSLGGRPFVDSEIRELQDSNLSSP